jgi:hypothetical protein
MIGPDDPLGKDAQTGNNPLVERLKLELADQLAEQPELATTFHISRFLRARNNDYVKAKVMLQNYLTHRKNRHLPSLAQKVLAQGHRDIWQDVYPQACCTLDYSGRPVMVTQVGHYDYKKIGKTFTIDDVLDFFTFNQEQILFTQFPFASQQVGHRVERIVVIADLRGMKVLDMTAAKSRKFLDTIAKLFQDNYPEIIDKSIIVNAPMGMGLIWSLGKKMIDKKTADKFEIFSNNGHQYLSKIMDVRMLPDFLGGQSKRSLKDFQGPTWAVKEEGWKSGNIFLEDRTPEYQYFYTEEERQKLGQASKQLTNSNLAEIGEIGTPPQVSIGVGGKAPSVFFSTDNKRKRPLNTTFSVRVEHYFQERQSMTQSQGPRTNFLV